MTLIAAVAAILRIKDATVRVADIAGAIARHKLELPIAVIDGAAAARKARKRADAERRLHYANLRRVTPTKYLPLVDKAENGSRVAAGKLACLQCANFCVAEVRHCIMAGSCGYWDFRPFQPRKKKET